MKQRTETGEKKKKNSISVSVSVKEKIEFGRILLLKCYSIDLLDIFIYRQRRYRQP